MKKEDSITSEEKILSAALNEFAGHGYAGARVDSIAEKAKVNKAMIYYHFKSKEMLYERILKDITDNIFGQVKEAAVSGTDPVDTLYSVISKYIKMLNSFDVKIFQIILREIASGGEHFRKIMIPNLVLPVLSIIEPLIMRGKDERRIRDLNPYFTFMQIIGGIFFFNIIRLPVEGSDLEKYILKDGYIDEYAENLFKILKSGIELKGDEL